AQFADNPVIAHRGAWKKNDLPENSIASLKEAIRIGCAGSEFDVHLTKDNVIVVNHDDAFFGIDIDKATYAELLAKKHKNGEFIPTAEAYLREGMKQQRTKLIYEIKVSTEGKERTLELTRRSVALVKKLKAEKWVEYISFDYDACLLVHQLDPQAGVYYLTGDKSPEQLQADGLRGLDYHFSVFDKQPGWLADALARKLVTNAWTVNEAAIMQKLLDQHIDFITTNEPELLFSLLKEKK
ncbi:MAG: glycerophosphodiester phosphodiesterase family protein, partial [Flavihumibacter sp.]